MPKTQLTTEEIKIIKKIHPRLKQVVEQSENTKAYGGQMNSILLFILKLPTILLFFGAAIYISILPIYLAWSSNWIAGILIGWAVIGAWILIIFEYVHDDGY